MTEHMIGTMRKELDLLISELGEKCLTSPEIIQKALEIESLFTSNK